MDSYDHSLHGDLLPDHAPGITRPQCQGDPTSKTLHLGSHVHSPQGDFTTQNQQPETAAHNLHGNPTSQTLYLEFHVHTLHDEPLPDYAPGITHPVSRVTPFPPTLGVI